MVKNIWEKNKIITGLVFIVTEIIFAWRDTACVACCGVGAECYKGGLQLRHDTLLYKEARAISTDGKARVSVSVFSVGRITYADRAS